VTTCPIVPPMLLAFSKSHVEESYDMTSLKTMTVGAAPIASDLLESLAKKFQCVIDQSNWILLVHKKNLRTHIKLAGHELYN